MSVTIPKAVGRGGSRDKDFPDRGTAEASSRIPIAPVSARVIQPTIKRANT